MNWDELRFLVESGDFVIRKLAVMGLAVYESAWADVSTGDDDWVAYNEDLAHVPEMRWLEGRIGPGRIRLRDSGTRMLCGAVASGIGRGVLPCVVGDAHPDLRRAAPREPVLFRDLWLLIHREVRESARVAVVAEWLAERFAADAHLLRGDLVAPARRPVRPVSPRGRRRGRSPG